jgi:hypothetical protein
MWFETVISLGTLNCGKSNPKGSKFKQLQLTQHQQLPDNMADIKQLKNYSSMPCIALGTIDMYHQNSGLKSFSGAPN